VKALTGVIAPVVAILVVLFLMPLIVDLGGAAAQTAEEAFNVTVDVGDNQYNVGGIAALIIMLTMIFIPVYAVERVLRGGG